MKPMKPKLSWYEKGHRYTEGNDLETERNLTIDEHIRSGVVDEIPESVKLTSHGLETDMENPDITPALDPFDPNEIMVDKNPSLSYEDKFAVKAIEIIESDPIFPSMEFDECPDRAASYLFAMGMEVGRKSVENADEDDYDLPGPNDAADSDELDGFKEFAYESSMSMRGQKSLFSRIRCKLPFTDDENKIYGLEVRQPIEDISENEVAHTLLGGTFTGAYLEPDAEPEA
jgi:hypothetical protein